MNFAFNHSHTRSFSGFSLRICRSFLAPATATRCRRLPCAAFSMSSVLPCAASRRRWSQTRSSTRSVRRCGGACRCFFLLFSGLFLLFSDLFCSFLPENRGVSVGKTLIFYRETLIFSACRTGLSRRTWSRPAHCSMYSDQPVQFCSIYILLYIHI